MNDSIISFIHYVLIYVIPIFISINVFTSFSKTVLYDNRRCFFGGVLDLISP